MMKYMLEENKKHGDAQFPVSLYTVTHTVEYGPVLPCHWHEEYEILYIRRGNALLRIGDHTYTAAEGDFFFINGGELHSAFSENPGGCCYDAVVFSLSFLNSSSNDACQQRYISRFMLKQYQLPHRLEDGNALKVQLQALIGILLDKLEKKNPGYELFLKGILLMILSLLAEESLLTEKQPARGDLAGTYKKGHTEKMKKVLDYISENYMQRIQLDELAALADMNRYNFCRFFKKHTDMTPVEYLNLHRVNEAFRLLQSADCTVTDAALQAGFESMSYFSRMFKRFKNVSPSQVRTSR